jgi:catalase (peroxidase I)
MDRHPRRFSVCSHAELRAIAGVYGCTDGQEKFVKDFVAAWNGIDPLWWNHLVTSLA